VRNNPLADGDVLHIGPFSFVVQIPAGHSIERQALDWHKAVRWDRSRRNLTRLAINLRKRLREARLASSAGASSLLNHDAAELSAKTHAYDERLGQLEEAERDLETNRESLLRERENHADHVQKVETELASRLQEADEEIHRRWLDFQQRCQREEKRLPNVAGLNQERQEIIAMKEKWAAEQASSLEFLEKQHAALAQAEAALTEQRAELGRMMSELRELQQAIRSQQNIDVEALSKENEELRRLVAQLEERLPAPHEAVKAPTSPAHPDLETYETELNQYRQQLENDRAKLNAEIDQVRTRNDELDDATREMEMEMSRERAELGRERTRLDRLREDVRAELERMQREAAVRETMAPVQKLREELSQKKQTGSLNDRLKTFRNRLSGPA
jgi:chromosome segregation ATPase